MGGTEKKNRQQGRCLDVQSEKRSIKGRKMQRWTGGSGGEKRSGGVRKREREEEALSVSLRAPAGGTSSCLPSQRRFLLHFK